MNKQEEDFRNVMNNFFLLWDQNAPVMMSDVKHVRESFIRWAEWLEKRNE